MGKITTRRKAIISKYVSGLSMKETAAALKITQQRVSQVMRESAPELIRKPPPGRPEPPKKRGVTRGI